MALLFCRVQRSTFRDCRELDAAAGRVPLLAGSVGPAADVLTLSSRLIFVMFNRASVSESDVKETKRRRNRVYETKHKSSVNLNKQLMKPTIRNESHSLT